DQDRLCELIQGNGDGVLARWYYYLERLTQRGLLPHTAHADGACLATRMAVSSSFASGSTQVIAGRRYVLSRFAYLRREGPEAVLESPLASARIILNGWAGAAPSPCSTTPAAAADGSPEDIRVEPAAWPEDPPDKRALTRPGQTPGPVRACPAVLRPYN